MEAGASMSDLSSALEYRRSRSYLREKPKDTTFIWDRKTTQYDIHAPGSSSRCRWNCSFSVTVALSAFASVFAILFFVSYCSAFRRNAPLPYSASRRLAKANEATETSLTEASGPPACGSANFQPSSTQQLQGRDPQTSGADSSEESNGANRRKRRRKEVSEGLEKSSGLQKKAMWSPKPSEQVSPFPDLHLHLTQPKDELSTIEYADIASDDHFLEPSRGLQATATSGTACQHMQSGTSLLATGRSVMAHSFINEEGSKHLTKGQKMMRCSTLQLPPACESSDVAVPPQVVQIVQQGSHSLLPQAATEKVKSTMPSHPESKPSTEQGYGDPNRQGLLQEVDEVIAHDWQAPSSEIVPNDQRPVQSVHPDPCDLTTFPPQCHLDGSQQRRMDSSDQSGNAEAPQNVEANCLATSSQAVANEQRPAHSVHSDDCGCRMDSQQGSIGLPDQSSDNEAIALACGNCKPSAGSTHSLEDGGGKNLETHPFFRLPRVVAGASVRAFMRSNTFQCTVWRSRPFFTLLSVRQLLKLPFVGSEDLHQLMICLEYLVSFAIFQMDCDLTGLRPRLVCSKLEIAFMVLDALFAVSEVLGAQAKRNEWWDEVTKGIPSYEIPKAKSLSNPATLKYIRLSQALKTGLDYYKRGRRPPAMLVIALKRGIISTQLALGVQKAFWEPLHFDDEEWSRLP